MAPDNLKVPRLYPICNGTEDKLIQCQHYGFAKFLPAACYDEPWRLFVVADTPFPIFYREHPDEDCRPPKVIIYFFSAKRMTYFAARKFCADIQDVEIDSEPSDKNSSIASEEEVANIKLNYRVHPPDFIYTLWLPNQSYIKGEDVYTNQNPNQTLPVICAVYTKCPSTD